MQPFSYTSLKILHDQNIQEALEHQRPDTEPKTPGQGLLQAFGTLLARFNNQSAQKQEECFHGCAREVDCAAS